MIPKVIELKRGRSGISSKAFGFGGFLQSLWPSPYALNGLQDCIIWSPLGFSFLPHASFPSLGKEQVMLSSILGSLLFFLTECTFSITLSLMNLIINAQIFVSERCPFGSMEQVRHHTKEAQSNLYYSFPGLTTVCSYTFTSLMSWLMCVLLVNFTQR